nr:esterase [Lysinibacillus timonensis]
MNTPYFFKHIGPNLEVDEKNAAVFLFHGLGSNEEDLFQLVESLKGKCHIFSLRGPITHSPGYAFYTFEEEGKPIRTIFDQMIIATKQFILEAVEQYHLDLEKIYLVGFNQGAVVTQTLAVIFGSELAGYASLSGYIPDFVKLEYRKNIQDLKLFISHGEYDFDYPISWAEESKKFFEENGAIVTYNKYPVGHGVSLENIEDLLAFIKIDWIN